MEYKVSVIIPVYNCERLLARAVNSVIGQHDFNSLQLILVDDGSVDGSSAICDSFAAEHENIIAVHQKNAGVSAARNKGLELAEGEWVSFLDSDDYLLDGFFEKMLSGETADLICCSYSGNVSDSSELDGMLENRIYSRGEFDTSLYPVMSGDYIFFQCWNKLYKKSIISEYNVNFPVGVRYAEDMKFVFEYAKHIDSFKFVSEPLYFYYVNENNATNVVKKGYETYEMIYLYMTSYFESIGYKPADLLQNYIFHSLGAIYTSAIQLNFISAYFYIRRILKKSVFYEKYSGKRIYMNSPGVNGYYDKFIMMKSPLLVILLARFNEFNMKRISKRGNNDD